jgi:hypothetical protein
VIPTKRMSGSQNVPHLCRKSAFGVKVNLARVMRCSPYPVQLATVATLGAFVGLLGWSSWRHTPVQSEVAHLAAGVSQCHFGTFDLYRVNPPLVRMIGALAVLSAEPSTDRHGVRQSPLDRREYRMGIDFCYSNRLRVFSLVRVARWACIPLNALGSYFCYLWARRLYGPTAGLMALLTWCLSPCALGHGATIMPDVPCAAMGVTGVYCFWLWLKKPQWLEAAISGLAVGTAELCKFTLLVLYPLLPVLWMVYRLPEWWAGNFSRRDHLRQCGLLATLLLLSIYVINCGYLFEGTFAPLDMFRFQTTLFTGYESLEDVPPQGGNRFAGTWLGKLPMPLPANMVQGIDTQRYDFERGLPSYLRGQWTDHGWWYYYLYALAVKMPAGMWCLAALALGVTICGQGHNASWRDEMLVLTPGLAILVFVSSQSGFSVHSRYAIPALPFLLIWTSKVARVFEMRPITTGRRALGTAVVVALTWSIGSSLWAYPHSLSHFNELVGGPKHGGEHLLDSNIDWGQDLLYLKDWLDRHPDVTLDGLAYSNSYPATLAGISETPYPPPEDEDEGGRQSLSRSAEIGTVPGGRAADQVGPKPGWYAVSVNYLYSRERQYRYFLDFKPVGSAGYSIYIYHITLDEANQVRRELRLPLLTCDGGSETSRERTGNPSKGE